MPENKSQSFLHGAAILAAGVVIMKILGAIYKIPLGNLLGDEGYAMFLAAYNVYNVFLTITTAGLPVALSRMVSEARTLGRENQVQRIFTAALKILFAAGLVCTVFMMIAHEWIADAMENIEAADSILALAPCVVIVCVLSAYRGYIQGHGNMKPTTISQVIEVLVKVIVGLILCWLSVRSGQRLSLSSAGAIFGVTAGGLVALIYIWRSKRKNYPLPATPADDVPDPTRVIVRKFLMIAIPITLGSSVLSLINFIDSYQIMKRLQLAAGFDYYNAKILYGIYGKAQTLYNLPASIITPLTVSVVPAIAAAVTRKNTRETMEITEASMRISSVIALPMAVGLAVLSDPIMNVIYPNSSESGPMLLALLGVAAYFVCMALIMTAIMQAHGDVRYPVYSMALGGLVKIAVNYFLVGMPSVNIIGAPVGTIACYIVMCAADFIFMRRCMEEKPSLRKILARPVLSTAVMGAAAWAVYGLSSKLLGGGELSWLTMAICMALAVCVAVVVYLVMIIATRAITMDDMKLIPKGEKLGRLLHIK